jgi:predicted acetyltransferase
MSAISVTIELCCNEGCKQVIHNLYQLYLHDLSSFTEENKIEQNGLFQTEHINVFWEKESLFPYLIYVDMKVCGFALVAGHPYAPEGADYSLVEFFVIREERRTGVGREAARLIFDSFRGTWDVYEVESNRPAVAFWTSVITEYTHDVFEVLSSGNQQRFSNIG